MLDDLVVNQQYTRAELAALGEPAIAGWQRCVFPRPPEDWCVLFVTLRGHHDYVNRVEGQQLQMSGNDGDKKINAWLVGSAATGYRVGLLLREHEAQPFTYKGEVTLVRGSASPAFFVWNLP